MVVVIIKSAAAPGQPKILKERAYPNDSFSGPVPDLAELEELAEEALEEVGCTPGEFQLLLDGRPLLNADAMQRVSECEGRVLLRLKVDGQLPGGPGGQLPAATDVGGAVAAATSEGAAFARLHVDDLQKHINVGIIELQGEGGSLKPVQQSLATWKAVKARAKVLETQGLRHEADSLVRRASKEMDKGVKELVTFHGSGKRLLSTFEDFADACGRGDAAGAKRLMRQASDLGQKLSATSAAMKGAFEAFSDALRSDTKDHEDEQKLARSRQWKSGVVAGVSGVGAAGAAVGALMVVNPVSLACLVCGGAVSAAVSLARTNDAVVQGGVKEKQGLMGEITQAVTGVSDSHEEAWKSLSWSAGCLANVLDDLERMSPGQRKSYQKALDDVVRSLVMVVNAQDAFLVMMFESNPCPCFSVRQLIGPSTYDRYKAALATVPKAIAK